VHPGKAVQGRDHRTELGAHPPQQLRDERVVVGEVAPVPDRLVVEGAVAEVADAVQQRRQGLAAPLLPRRVREDLLPEQPRPEHPVLFVTHVEECGPEAEAELRHQPARLDWLPAPAEPLPGRAHRLRLVGVQDPRVLQPAGGRSARRRRAGERVRGRGGFEHQVAQRDLEEVERGVECLAKSGVPEAPREHLLVALRAAAIGAHPFRGDEPPERGGREGLRESGHGGILGSQSPGDCSPGLVPVINPGSFFVRESRAVSVYCRSGVPG